ncbi:MAG: acyltransferase [bacterium]|nr:acyltransferase [bacterium]
MKKKISSTAIIHENVFIEEDVIIHDNVVIYPNTIIKKGAEIFDNTVIGKQPKAPGCTERAVDIIKKPTIIGENTIISTLCSIYAGVEIGNNSLIGDGASIREDCKIGSYTIVSRNVTVNYETIIGNHTKIMDNSHITGNAVIGDNVFISVMVSTTNDNAMGGKGYNEEVVGPIIKDGAKIGASASILPNVIIGENSIVGSGAVVTKNVDDNCVVMGVPAKLIRKIEKEDNIKVKQKRINS